MYTYLYNYQLACCISTLNIDSKYRYSAIDFMSDCQIIFHLLLGPDDYVFKWYIIYIINYIFY